jgi:hypothetical protein
MRKWRRRNAGMMDRMNSENGKWSIDIRLEKDVCLVGERESDC